MASANLNNIRTTVLTSYQQYEAQSERATDVNERLEQQWANLTRELESQEAQSSGTAQTMGPELVTQQEVSVIHELCRYELIRRVTRAIVLASGVEWVEDAKLREIVLGVEDEMDVDT